MQSNFLIMGRVHYIAKSKDEDKPNAFHLRIRGRSINDIPIVAAIDIPKNPLISPDNRDKNKFIVTFTARADDSNLPPKMIEKEITLNPKEMDKLTVDIVVKIKFKNNIKICSENKKKKISYQEMPDEQPIVPCI
ncbi:MAG: hypothetical protein GY705_09145 [Bacteroidetes bacterium]|nr:hypothetical protein [Bacteroidota bacterium]